MTEDEASIEGRLRDLGRRLRDAERARDEAHADELAAAAADDDDAFREARDRRAYHDDKIAALSEVMASELMSGSESESAIDWIPLQKFKTKFSYETMRKKAVARQIPARKNGGRWEIPRQFKLTR
jgi:hypothetical protein